MEAVTYRFEPVNACAMCGAQRGRLLGRRLNVHQGLRPRRAAIATTVVKCRGCGLIYSNPRPIPESVAEHYDRPPEDYWAEGYFRRGDGYFTDEINAFEQLWQGRGRPRALDVGAGIGIGMAALADHGCETFGLEPSAPFRDRAIANDIPADRLQLATLEEAEYEPASFDLISFAAVLEHLHDPAAALERALGWLAADGLIHVEVPSTRWLMSRALNTVYRLQGLDYVTNLSPMHPPYHLYEFTPEAFCRHGERARYEVALHRILDYSPTYLPKPLEAPALRLMNATGTNMQLQVWLRAMR